MLGSGICTGSTSLQGTNMVTDPSKDMVTDPARSVPACLVNRYVEAEVRQPAFSRIYQAAAGDVEM
jgi:hypothetical protein